MRQWRVVQAGGEVKRCVYILKCSIRNRVRANGDDGFKNEMLNQNIYLFSTCPVLSLARSTTTSQTRRTCMRAYRECYRLDLLHLGMLTQGLMAVTSCPAGLLLAGPVFVMYF